MYNRTCSSLLQVEINPFGLTPQKQVVSFDAKIQFDDNAEFRQKKLFEMDDKAEKVCNLQRNVSSDMALQVSYSYIGSA